MKGLGVKIKYTRTGSPNQGERYTERHRMFTECLNGILQEDPDLDIDIAIDRAVEILK